MEFLRPIYNITRFNDFRKKSVEKTLLHLIDKKICRLLHSYYILT